VSGAAIMDVFGLLQESGVTIMVVTHDPEVAERADRTVEIRDGRLFGDEDRRPGRNEENGGER
jgi:putative ABC transport system ATP-binding protein